MPKKPPFIDWKPSDRDVHAAFQTIGPVQIPRFVYKALDAMWQCEGDTEDWHTSFKDGSILKVQNDGRPICSSCADPSKYTWVPVIVMEDLPAFKRAARRS